MSTVSITSVAHAPTNMHTSVSSGDHSFTLDQPAAMGGQDEGMSPVQALLGALAACKAMGARVMARRAGIKLNDISVECTGILDPTGVLSKDPDVRVGPTDVHTVYRIDADNTAEELDAFVELVENRCPVQDAMVNPVSFTLERA